jgi:CMP/dCMP kinase
MIIAVDGPAASGKGTLAKRLAKYFDLAYLDTGSLYRGLAFKVLQTNTDYNDMDAVCELAKTLKDEDYAKKELGEEVIGALASKLAQNQRVRDFFLALQKKVAYNPKGSALDGRDIGTVICPDADFKFFIVADVEIRAERRHGDLIAMGKDVTYEQVLQSLSERDKRDSERSNAPLKKAEGACEINSTHITPDDVFAQALEFIQKGIKNRQ